MSFILHPTYIPRIRLAWRQQRYKLRDEDNLMRLILLIIVVILLLGALPTWPYSTGWGYYPSGGLGLILLILIILVVLKKL